VALQASKALNSWHGTVYKVGSIFHIIGKWSVEVDLFLPLTKTWNITFKSIDYKKVLTIFFIDFNNLNNLYSSKHSLKGSIDVKGSSQNY